MKLEAKKPIDRSFASCKSSRGGSTGGSAELTVEASPSARLSSPNVRSLTPRSERRQETGDGRRETAIRDRI